MKRSIVASIFLIIAASCGGASREREVSVAAAANLAVPLAEIRRAFTSENPGVAVTVTFGASGRLTTQILAGAPFDVFLSADEAYPEQLKKRGAVAAGPAVYAAGRLILFSARPRRFGRGTGILGDESIKIVSVANPATAPYGRAAMEAIESSGLADALKDKIAYAQSVAQVVQQVATAADVGFIAQSSLYSDDMKKFDREGVYWIEVDPETYHPIRQAAVILKRGAGNPDVRRFYEWIFSAEAKAVFANCGYGVE